jgi:hypothetical protein
VELSQKSSVEVVDVMQVSEVLEAMVELVKRELLVVEEITVDSVSLLSFLD